METNILNSTTIKRYKLVKKGDAPIKDALANLDALFQFELEYQRIPYSRSEQVIHEFKRAPNFVIPKYKLLIYIGDESDMLLNKNSGWKTFKFSESEIRKSASDCARQLSTYIRKQKANYAESYFSFIDLFSGIGGFRIPIEQLGGKCLGYSEIDKKSIETYKLNFDEYPIETEQYLGDITTLGKVPNVQIDLVVGGVPCQAWSVAGKMKGFDDPRGKLWQDAIRVVKLNRPKAFVFENVKGLADPRNKANLELIVTELNNLGYNVPKPRLLNSYDFGVPQNRDRIFIVGIRDDLELESKFKYPLPIKSKPKLSDILENIQTKKIKKQKINIDQLHGGKIPLSRNRFQKVDEFNDFFVFCDTRNGHSTIHSWDLIRTSKREKEICMTILKNRRKKKYGTKDGNPLSYQDLSELINKLKESELEKLVTKKILKRTDKKYEFQNSKNSAGINGIYRIYLPNSDIFSTLTATGTKDMIALENVQGKDVEEFKLNFINNIYKQKKFRAITSIEAGRLQGFPSNFAVHPNEHLAKKQFGNAVSTPVIYNLVNEVIKTGIFKDESSTKGRNLIEIQNMV